LEPIGIYSNILVSLTVEQNVAKILVSEVAIKNMDNNKFKTIGTAS
jgi:hypothetical protein